MLICFGFVYSLLLDYVEDNRSILGYFFFENMLEFM